MLPLHTVVETPEFLAGARRVLTGAERQEPIDFLAAHPGTGELTPGTGGARKLRGEPGEGASGAGRGRSPITAVQIFRFSCLLCLARVSRADLTNAERNELREVLGSLAGEYRERAG